MSFFYGNILNQLLFFKAQQCTHDVGGRLVRNWFGSEELEESEEILKLLGSESEYFKSY